MQAQEKADTISELNHRRVEVMSRYAIITAIAACYFVFAILLNSVGTVILQSIDSLGVSKPQASTLEGFKDLSIAIFSFVVASFIPRVGYKIALLTGVMIVGIACLITPLIADFWMIKVLFAAIGISFALVKVSVYSIVGQLTNSTSQHSSLLNTVEGIFMLGSLTGYWMFSLYIDANNPLSLDWLNVYYPLAGLCCLAIVLVLFSPIANAEIAVIKRGAIDNFMDMLKMSYQPLVLIFIMSIFLYVLIEQSIGSWLPTFNNEVLNLPTDISVQMASIFAGSLALGRLLAGQVLRFVNWYLFLNICLIIMIINILLTLPLTHDVSNMQITNIVDAPFVAYLLPLIGLVMAPIYPILNSVMLSNLAKEKQASMTGLIVVFSALGGTTGSLITGFVFGSMGGQQAFYLSVVPMVFLLATLYFFRRLSHANTTSGC